jgi:hypothetical protein
MFAVTALSEIAVKATQITGLVALKQPRDSLIFAIGPEFNRLLFSDPDPVRPTRFNLAVSEGFRPTPCRHC